MAVLVFLRAGVLGWLLVDARLLLNSLAFLSFVFDWAVPIPTCSANAVGQPIWGSYLARAVSKQSRTESPWYVSALLRAYAGLIVVSMLK